MAENETDSNQQVDDKSKLTLIELVGCILLIVALKDLPLFILLFPIGVILLRKKILLLFKSIKKTGEYTLGKMLLFGYIISACIMISIKTPELLSIREKNLTYEEGKKLIEIGNIDEGLTKLESIKDRLKDEELLLYENTLLAIKIRAKENIREIKHFNDLLKSITEEQFLSIEEGNFLNLTPNNDLNKLLSQTLKNNKKIWTQMKLEQLKLEEMKLIVAEKKERQKKIDSHFSYFNGSNKRLVEYVKDRLHDPSSFEHVKTVYSDKGKYIDITMAYRAKNVFGGLVLNSIKAHLYLENNHLEVFQ
ncbi:hypothetical protein LPTSP4_09310 [Leptospira ryugenii]|uniref:Uncharacterized protein n=1 Tax=Leptospira ryugenii TaxID=1917863 RepID=A0A2P2DXQ2_9LEPT|nr:hypothetical protein [Leptospira ryugenii]GBF49418.1 hypothetical protein LPTSP4_09310 [Leptospira ryugenii]